MLINPSSRDILTNAGDRPPIGLLSIASSLKEAGIKVRVRDMDHCSMERLVYELDNKTPEYVGVSVYTSPVYPEAVRLGQMCASRGIRTIAGGYHATAMPQTLSPYFNTVVVGEGEEITPVMIKHGLPNKVVTPNPTNLRRMAIPGREFVNMADYTFRQDGRKASTSITSRGCANGCIFCGNMNRRVRYHTDDYVTRDIRQLKEYGFRDIYFLDDAFTTNRRRTLGLLDKIGDEDIRFRLTTRANMLDDDLVRNLSQAGCSWVSLGIESGVDERLDDVSKRMTTQDNLNAVRTLTKYRIKSKGFFMFGLPNETLADATRTINFALGLKQEGLTSADFYIMTPFPGTPIWRQPQEFGIEILDRDYTKYLEAGKKPPKAFHRTNGMSAQQIEDVRNIAEEQWKNS